MGDREFAWAAIHAFLEAAMENETRPAVNDALRVLAEGRPKLDIRPGENENGSGEAH